MTDIQEIYVLDISDSVESIKSTDSKGNYPEERSAFKRMNPDSDMPDESVKNPRLEPVKLFKMTQEVKEEVEENLASFDKEFSPEIDVNFFATDFNNDIDPFQDLPDQLESIKQEPVREKKSITVVPNENPPYETCTQRVQNPELNLTFNDVSILISEMKGTANQTEVATSILENESPVDQIAQAFPLVNEIPNGMILSLPTHCQNKPSLINIPKVVKLKQVFPRIVKKLPASTLSTAPLLSRTEYVTELRNVDKVSKNMGTHCKDSERKANLHDRESQVEEEFLAEIKEQNMSVETLTNFLILRNPYLYTGLYGNVFSSFVNMTVKGRNESCRDVLMTLMKIRLDDSFRKLEDLFGILEGQARTIFERIVLSLATILKKFIFPTDKPDKRDKKVILFQKNQIHKIHSVIDYFYVRTHVPGDWRHDNCESVKFLVSCTVDGVINFVSHWYPRNEKDLTVLTSSGYLQNLGKRIIVVANRRFYGIEKVLREKNCTLVGPSSISNNFGVETLARHRKKLRLVFASLREFEYIGSKACIHKDELNHLNQILIIASAIVNSLILTASI